MPIGTVRFFRQNRDARTAAIWASVKGMAVEEKALQHDKIGKLRDLREARDATGVPSAKEKPAKKR